jgi:hypothetical protein
VDQRGESLDLDQLENTEKIKGVKKRGSKSDRKETSQKGCRNG